MYTRILFTVYIVKQAKRKENENDDGDEERKILKRTLNVLYIFVCVNEKVNRWVKLKMSEYIMHTEQK